MAKKYDKNKKWGKGVGRTDTRRDGKFADSLRGGKPPGGFYRPGKSGTKKQ